MQAGGCKKRRHPCRSAIPRTQLQRCLLSIMIGRQSAQKVTACVLFLLVVLVEAATGFAAQSILLDHLLQESGWLIRRVATLLVAHLHDVIQDIAAAEIGQLE